MNKRLRKPKTKLTKLTEEQYKELVTKGWIKPKYENSKANTE